MVGVRKRGEEIRQFILDNVEHHPKDIVQLTAQAFGITRQAANKHLAYLVDQKAVIPHGATRSRHYRLHPLVEWQKSYPLDGKLEEDVIWRNDIRHLLGAFPDNVLEIWNYGFTEMFNNALDHSAGTTIMIMVEKTATITDIKVIDNGVGIFKKIQRELQLNDERHAVLELAKGKLTTDPINHTGEGIFFASRMFDDFGILSGSTFFSHVYSEVEDWILERQRDTPGTLVYMKLKNNTARTTKKVFEEFTSEGTFGFTKTVVPVKLAQYGDEALISRSQAKRLLTRIDRFKVVILDFQEVAVIGQAFADEVFRVFRQQHPEIELLDINANDEIKMMIRRSVEPGQAEIPGQV